MRSVHTCEGSAGRRHDLVSPFRTTAPSRHRQQQGEQCGEDSTKDSHERHKRFGTRSNEGRPQAYRRSRDDSVGAFLILRRLKAYTRVRDHRTGWLRGQSANARQRVGKCLTHATQSASELRTSEELGVHRDDDGAEGHEYSANGGRQHDAPRRKHASSERNSNDVVARCPPQVLHHLAIARA